MRNIICKFNYSMANLTINIEHLYKEINHRRILSDISLQAREGEVIGLLGPNGAGKSTLMKIITGLWDFDGGKVEVLGNDMSVSPHAIAAKIGYLPENNPLYEDMYIVQYLQFMAKISGVPRPQRSERVEQMLDRIGLRPEADKRIRQLSKGYRQRVGLAQALMGNPRLLILDEPTTGLDINQLEEIRELIKTLSYDRTIILSTHILQEITAVCSRVVIISNGTIRDDSNDLSNLEQRFREKTID